MLASDAFVEFNLASNQPGTALIAPQDDEPLPFPLVDWFWGIAASPGADGGFSVSDTLGGQANAYSGDVAGSPFVQNGGQTVDVPRATGQVYNGNPNEFILNAPPTTDNGSPSPVSAPAEFIYASLNGNLYGSNPALGQHAAPAASVKGAAFTGLALAKSGHGDQLYAADFLGGKIDVFDAKFQPVKTSGSFTDPKLPANYRPFNIQALDNPTRGTELYVSYAPSIISTFESQTDDALPPIPAPGGVVDVFDVNGNFLGRIASGSPLDQPWGMVLAPASFGKFAGDLLVANHGDGKINVFDPTPGATPAASLGVLSGADGTPFVVNGLLGLAVGNGGATTNNAGDSGALYFTAGSFSDVVHPLDSTGGELTLDPSHFAVPHSIGLFGTIQVSGTNPLVGVGTNTTVPVGKPFTRTLATFGSAELPDPASNRPVSYTASIDWGDSGSVTRGKVLPTGNGGYIVEGSYTYASAGSENYKVMVADNGGGAILTIRGTNLVAEAPLVAHALPVHSQSLVLGDDTRLAMFIDPGGADPLGNYSATINWGDKSPPSKGTISAISLVPGGTVVGDYFAVAGGHTYALAGDYTFTVAIHDRDGSDATVTGTAHVTQPTLRAKALPVRSAILTITGTNMAVFEGTGGAAPAGDYTATIDWGDKSAPSSGTIRPFVADSDAGKPIFGDLIYAVAGSHTYAAAGDYTFTVAITDKAGGQSTTVTGTARVALAPLLVAGVPVVVSSGLSVNGAIVGAFADAGGGDAASNYSATIDWGDGTTSPADSITGSGNSFVILGSHTYAAQGVYKLEVNVADQDGSTGHGGSHAFVDSPIASYVAKAFQDILHRAAGDDGLSYWTQKIDAGMSPADFAGDLTHSAEYFATNVIVPAYQKYLGRSADAAGLAHWTGQMQHGLTDQQLQAALIASPEFYTNAGGGDADWINALYKSVLGRPADGGGLRFWEKQLAGGTSRATVAIDFATSQEHASEAVQNDYFTYLGRAPSAAEVDYWVAKFERGATNEDVIAGFVGSPEFVKAHS